MGFIAGCALETDMVLCQLLAERVRLSSSVNEVGRSIMDLHTELKDMPWCSCKATGDVNVSIAAYNDVLMGDVQVGPEKGTAISDSGLQCWGLKVGFFAKIYAAKMGVDKERQLL